MLADLTVKDFLAKTAGNEPVPGGGSVSALNGAVAAALGQMVANLTISRKKYADVEEEMRGIASTLEQARDRLTRLIDKDSDAYNEVFEAYKLPKETDEQKAARAGVIQEATKRAALVPLEVAEVVAGIMPSIEQVELKGNQNAVTDAGVAMMTARTAVLGALLNVRVNLSGIDDAAFVENLEVRIEELARKVIDLEEKVITEINNKL
ncbi:MAG: cyclodeaminase/cyclohydrolase family protein [Mediterranea sp.]|jgi:formiminotetrahydrofolate cyclodeaminase|nr:cyclodeaminase/cyclohydrolase family protein [Mediterranea sp.]